MKNHKTAGAAIIAAFILISCTACNKGTKSVPTMATVSSMSSDIGVSSLADSMASSAVCSAASSSASSAVSKASSSSSSAASKSTGNSTAKPTGGSTAKPSGGSTTKPSGGGSTGGSNTKPSGGGSTTGGGTTTTAQPAGIQTVGYESKYGCQNQDQYNYVRQRASAVSYSQAEFDQCKQLWSGNVPYSDALNAAQLLVGNTPHTSGQSSNAYDVFASHNGKCDGVARAAIAILQTHGYNAKVAYGKNSGGAGHAWVTFECGGTWYSIGGDLYAGSTPAGYSLSYTSYQ